MDAVEEIEEALVLHWSNFGRIPGGELHEEKGVTWFETPVQRLPYNGVIRTRLPDDQRADEVVERICERMRTRGTDLFWMETPNGAPPDLGARLKGHGLAPVETLIGMLLDLERVGGVDGEPAAGLRVVEVLSDGELEEFIGLTAAYWELDGSQREEMAEIHRLYRPGLAWGHRYLAYYEGRPVGKGYLSTAGPEGVASIYGMSVLPEARGRGVASALTGALLRRAREEGFSRVALHSSEMAEGVYRRAGFAAVCQLTVWATAALWADEH